MSDQKLSGTRFYSFCKRLFYVAFVIVLPLLACENSILDTGSIPSQQASGDYEVTISVITQDLDQNNPLNHEEANPSIAGSTQVITCVPSSNSVQTAIVTRIIDGDTIEVEIEGQTYRVRYIGIDTPEKDEPGYSEATQYNKSLVNQKQVTMIKDVSETDQYGRLLRYVFVEGTFVNYSIIRQGFARTLTYPPDVACSEVFALAQRDASEDGIGLWQTSNAGDDQQTNSPLVEISFIFFDGIEGRNEPDEYVEILNTTDESIDLEGWTLADNSQRTFHFPSYVLEAGGKCRIYTNQDHPDWCGFSYQQADSAIWNNGGDCATLKDDQDQVIDSYCYTNDK